MKIERRNYPITDMEVRSEEGKPTTLRGYAAVFDQLSVPLYGFREKIQKGAFAESISKNNIKALWNHNSDFPLGSTNGSTLRLEEDERGLLFELDLPDNSWGRDAGVAIQRKDVDGVSFGFSVKKDSWDNTNPEQSIRTLEDVELIEISPTPFPAYPSTNVSARSVTEAIQDVDFKEILRSVIKDVMQEERQAPPNEPTPSYSIDILMRRLVLEENY
ncbi:HK97 family phage prohead protease [Sporosarcina sp. FSL W7-1283]|uniref:HK97 family phage prohead protease n=1 Tax=Sporosarcina sp. FSL W7-1283 TaxID=2921560 RepID=UPI0030FB905A